MHPRDLAWRGHTDHRGMFDTMFSYQELFKAEPPRAWADMNRLLLDKKKNPSRVKSARTYKRPSRPRNVGSGGFFLRYIQQPVAHYYFTAPAATMPGARTGL